MDGGPGAYAITVFTLRTTTAYYPPLLTRGVCYYSAYTTNHDSLSLPTPPDLYVWAGRAAAFLLATSSRDDGCDGDRRDVVCDVGDGVDDGVKRAIGSAASAATKRRQKRRGLECCCWCWSSSSRCCCDAAILKKMMMRAKEEMMMKMRRRKKSRQPLPIIEAEC